MPIYEYQCQACHDEFEVSQKINDAPLAACPKCDGPVQKKISLGSFALKGSGWYKTDYAGKGATSANAAKDPAPAPACAAGGSKPACAGCPSAGA
ncbi:MAG: FmdB family zinc ribbon protein [Deferrisomatales bacterium]